MTTFLSDTLASVDPAEVQGTRGDHQGMLDKAAERIDTAFPDQPLVEATLRTTIGNTYRALGEYPTAERASRDRTGAPGAGTGRGAPDTLFPRNVLAIIYRRSVDIAQVEPCICGHSKPTRRVLGEKHPNTLIVMSELAALTGSRAVLTRPNRFTWNTLNAGGMYWKR